MLNNKVKFEEKVYLEVKYSEGMVSKVNVGEKIKSGDLLFTQISKEEKQKIKYTGSAKVKVGDKISPGDVLFETSGVFRKKTVSKTEAEVTKISKTSIYLKNAENSNGKGNEREEVRSPFDSVVEKILKDRIILSFSALTISLFESKGDPVFANLKYIPNIKFKDRKNPPQNIEDSIIITDKLTSETYPMLSTLGAVGVISNSIDYYLYRDIIILAVPVGIVSGFGTLKEDKILLKYLQDREDFIVWLDTTYNRLVIPEKKMPVDLKNYKFDLKNE